MAKVTKLYVSSPLFCCVLLTSSLLQPGVPPGDVIFVLHLQRHESFERSGNDLLAKVKLTLSEALLGFSRIVLTHLDGRGMKVSSPPDKVIATGDTIVLKGEGMPHRGHPDKHGDLYVVFDVEFPSQEWLRTVDRKVRVYLFIECHIQFLLPAL